LATPRKDGGNAAESDRLENGRFAPGNRVHVLATRKGVRPRATQLAEKLLKGDAEDIMHTVIEAAKNRDPVAMKLMVDRIWPLKKEARPLVDLPKQTIALPEIKTPEDVKAALGTLLSLVGKGEINIDEATGVAGLAEMMRKAIETADLLPRLEALEQTTKEPSE
jgi:hypothetical protein